MKATRENPISPFNAIDIPDAEWVSWINERTEALFFRICKASEKKSDEALAAIRKDYLLPEKWKFPSRMMELDNPFSLFWNGLTPASYLISQGDWESADFLLKNQFSYIEKMRLEFRICRIYYEFFDINKIPFYEDFDAFKKAAFNNNYAAAAIGYSRQTLLEPMLFYYCKFIEPLTAYLPSFSYPQHSLYFYAQACLGNSQKVNCFLEENMDAAAKKIHVKNISYFYARNGHFSALDAMHKMHGSDQIAIFKGCIQTGYFNKAFAYLTDIAKGGMIASRLYKNCQYGNLHHASIMFPLAVAIHDTPLKRLIFSPQKSLPPELLHLLHQAESVNHWISTYNLDLKLSLICSRQKFSKTQLPILLQYILEIPQYRKHFIALDISLNILAFLTEPELPREEAVEFFLKVSFVFNKNFLISDLDRYLKPRHGSWPLHRLRVNSFRQACYETNTVPALRNLISQQLGFFAGTIKANPESKHWHEKPYKKNKDAFIDILEKFNRRLCS